MNTFLETVLPSQGVYCALGIKFKTKKTDKDNITTTFHEDVSEIAEVGARHDSAGTDAYYALASFISPAGGRKQANAAFMRCFFIELDCGEGKPYATQADAVVALRSFVKARKLPTPTIVNSGGGVHVYWAVDRDVPVIEWLPIAKSLKNACLSDGLKIDPVITADSARVLRIPGTNNYKQVGNPRPVSIANPIAVYAVERITQCLPAVLVDFSSVRMEGADDITRDLAGGANFPDSKFSRIVRRSMKGTGCAQIKHIVLEARTLEEPMWRAGLSIANCCIDRAEAIHKISRTHSGYSPEAAEAKAAGTKGPYKCEWFKENAPERCEGCKQKCTSPIALGHVTAAAVESEDGGYVVEAPLGPSTGETPAPVVTVVIPKLPFPYFRGAKGGIYLRSRDADGNVEEIEVYAQDLYLTSRFYDLDQEGKGDGEMVGINLHLQLDGVRRFHAPLTALFAKDSLRDILIKHGAIAYGKQLDLIMNYFGSTVRQLQAMYIAHRTRNQMGWTPDMQGFVVGEVEYTVNGTRLAPPASGTRQLAPAFQFTGELSKWTEMANFYNRPGMQAHSLALCFGFGSVLLKLVSSGSVKGAMINLMSNESGTGKTTAQMMINSIFGHPTELLMGKSDTSAAKTHRLGLMNSICQTVDEITNMEDKDLSEFVYGTTTGRGKHRMESQTNSLRANHTTWCNISVTSSNSSVVDKLSQLKSTPDGELRRVIEIHVPVPTGASKRESDLVFRDIENNYGLAGPKFIQYVLVNRVHVIQTIQALQLKLDAELGLNSADRYYSIITACALAGGFIAKHLELFSPDMEELYKYAVSIVGNNKVTTSNATGDPITIAKEVLTAYINDNINSVLVINSAGRGGIPAAPIRDIRGNQLKIRYEPDTSMLFVVCSDFKRFMHSRQVDVARSLQALASAGLLKYNGAEKSKRIGVGALSGVPSLPTRCFCFDGKAIGIDTEMFGELGDGKQERD